MVLLVGLSVIINIIMLEVKLNVNGVIHGPGLPPFLFCRSRPDFEVNIPPSNLTKLGHVNTLKFITELSNCWDSKHNKRFIIIWSGLNLPLIPISR